MAAADLPAAIQDPLYPNALHSEIITTQSEGSASTGESTLVTPASNIEKAGKEQFSSERPSRKRSVSLKEPTDRPSRSRAKSEAKGSKLTPLASRGEEDHEEETPAVIRVPTFNNRSVYYSSGGPGSALRKYASEGAKMTGYRLYPKHDPRARRGAPGLFSLVNDEFMHADEVGYRGSMFHGDDDGPEDESPGDAEKGKKEEDPNLVVFDGPDDPLNPQVSHNAF